MGIACDSGAFESGATRVIVPARPLPARHGVTGGRLLFVPTAAQPGVGHGDYRPCGPGARPSKLVTGGFFEPHDAQLVTRTALVFRREQGTEARFGNLLVVLGGTRGRVIALVAPARGAVPLFDVVGVGYSRRPIGSDDRSRSRRPVAAIARCCPYG